MTRLVCCLDSCLVSKTITRQGKAITRQTQDNHTRQSQDNHRIFMRHPQDNHKTSCKKGKKKSEDRFFFLRGQKIGKIFLRGHQKKTHTKSLEIINFYKLQFFVINLQLKALSCNIATLLVYPTAPSRNRGQVRECLPQHLVSLTMILEQRLHLL